MSNEPELSPPPRYRPTRWGLLRGSGRQQRTAEPRHSSLVPTPGLVLGVVRVIEFERIHFRVTGPGRMPRMDDLRGPSPRVKGRGREVSFYLPGRLLRRARGANLHQKDFTSCQEKESSGPAGIWTWGTATVRGGEYAEPEGQNNQGKSPSISGRGLRVKRGTLADKGSSSPFRTSTPFQARRMT